MNKKTLLVVFAMSQSFLSHGMNKIIEKNSMKKSMNSSLNSSIGQSGSSPKKVDLIVEEMRKQNPFNMHDPFNENALKANMAIHNMYNNNPQPEERDDKSLKQSLYSQWPTLEALDKNETEKYAYQPQIDLREPTLGDYILKTGVTLKKNYTKLSDKSMNLYFELQDKLKKAQLDRADRAALRKLQEAHKAQTDKGYVFNPNFKSEEKSDLGGWEIVNPNEGQ